MSPDGEFILIGGYKGTRRISVSMQGEEWRVEEKWTTTQIKPFFNDLVIHNSHAYGFFGPALTCIDTEDGKRKWKSGRFGGQSGR